MISAGVAKLARYVAELCRRRLGRQQDSRCSGCLWKTTTALLAAQGGANLIYGAGMLKLGVTFDYAQLAMDNEVFKMIKKAIGGIEISDEKMALKVIHEVGPGGQFIDHEHTYYNFRPEQPQGRLIIRQNRAG